MFDFFGVRRLVYPESRFIGMKGRRFRTAGFQPAAFRELLRKQLCFYSGA
jgi:hypothetical protein